MARIITQAEYGSLTSRMFELLQRVDRKDSLLLDVSLLLEAEVAVLVERRANPSHPVSVVEARPKNRLNWAKRNIDKLRWWGQTDPAKDVNGYPRQKEISISNRKFPDALVAFGGNLPRKTPHIHELILLLGRTARFKYSTYQCAIAATLLRQYELLSENKALLNASQKAKENYAALLSLAALSQSDWNVFLQRVQKEDSRKLERAAFMGPAALLSHAYILWNRSTLTDPEQRRRPYEWLKSPKKTPGWGLYKRLSNDLGSPEGWVKLRPLTAKTVQEILNSLNRVHDIPFTDSEVFKAALIALEHGWRVVSSFFERETIQKKKYSTYELPRTDFAALLFLTSKLASDVLAKRRNRNKGRSVIGRETLHLYFAVLLCNSELLKKNYLRIEGGLNDGHRQVADEVHREFTLNLSRFMLGVVRILQRLSRVVADPSSVSPVEVLDGLLYMVDRFVHVELGVDERLHLREHLGRGIAAEVHRHIDQRFYRDHLIHVIDVFLLGHLLLNTRGRWLDVADQRLVDYIAHMDIEDASQKVGRRLAELCFRDWAVAALMHDLDYQLLEFSEDWDERESTGSFFALPRTAGTQWVDMTNQTELAWKERLERFVSECCLNRDKWLPDPGAFEIRGHGVLSALRVAQLLSFADLEGLIGHKNSDLPLVRSYRRSLHAIAHHDLFNHKVCFETHPLSCLLRLCDELQEWGRPRVNIEHMVKHLYLQIEQNYGSSFDVRESLAWIDANLKYTPDGNGSLSVRLEDERPEMDFNLVYRNPVEAQYDAITTFLCKAYNLQQIELSRKRTENSADMEWKLQLRFPRPKEYHGMTELDIYGLLRERVRVLPELLRFKNVDNAESGLVWLTDESPLPELENTDCVAIIVTELSTPENRCGWQTSDPKNLKGHLIDLKRQLLARRALGPQQGLLNWPDA